MLLWCLIVSVVSRLIIEHPIPRKCCWESQAGVITSGRIRPTVHARGMVLRDLFNTPPVGNLGGYEYVSPIRLRNQKWDKYHYSYGSIEIFY